ncbi:MAG: UDP-N-acetylmuramate--L-alanine ligase [Myxococcota bacterium]
MLDGVSRVHLIGIGGIGVSGVARALMALGYQVTGSDVRQSQLTEALAAEGATVTIGHDAKLIDGADLVVYSTAVPDTNPELVAARERGVPVRHRAELLGAVLARHKVAVGVIGTHGKGTVSSGISWILEQDGRNPAFIIGGMLHDFGRLNARLNDGSLIVAEVDESDGSLRHVHPTLMVLNNLEADHLNYYDSLEHIQDTVAAALADNPRLEHVVVNRDDPGAAALIERIAVPVTTFGRADGADVQARDIRLEPMRSSFDLWVRGESRGRVEVALPGLYNLDNALAAIAAGLHLGAKLDAIQRAYASFHGLENRFTVVEAGGRRIIKDYISHPTGIRRVLEAASADGRRLTAVFKPYRFTMIHYLQEDYAEAFHDASETVITELYTAGELAIPGIDTEYLCEKIRSRGPKVTYIQEMDAITEYLHAEVKDGEQVVFFGGDDLFRLADRYTEELRARAGEA